MYFKIRQPNKGEILVAWQKYKANRPEELTLIEGETVELLNTEDPSKSSSKRIKLDPELDNLASSGTLLDSSAAKHKLSVKPHRRHASSRYSPTRSHLDTRWLVRQVEGEKRQGWVPCYVLQSVDEPTPGSGLPGDAAFRRQAVVKELVETEQEFVKDLDYVVQEYLIRTEGAKVPKIIKDNLELVFGGLVEIADFHRTVLMEGVKYYANEPNLLGKAFLRLERDFDKHVNYCTDEPLAQTFLESCDVAKDYYDELSQRLGDDKTLSEHLKLPIQRINDYQLLLKELVRYSECLGEDCANLQKALELMLSVPHRAQDDKFTSSIEGYRGSIHKLGRLVSHDWFSVTFGNTTKERYLFLFKARILISKVRRISDDRSVFQLKDIIRLPQVEIKDHPDNRTFELVDKVAGHSLILAAHRDHVKDLWLKEIREFASDVEEHTEDIQLLSEATSTLTSEVVPSDVKPFAPPQVSEAQKLLAAALKAGVQERKLKATEAPKIEVVEPTEEPKAKVPKLTETQPKSSEPSKPVESPKPEVAKPPEATKPTENPKSAENPKPTVTTPKPVAKVEAQISVDKPKQTETTKLAETSIENTNTETFKPVETQKLEKPKAEEPKPKTSIKTVLVKSPVEEQKPNQIEAPQNQTGTQKPIESSAKPKPPEQPEVADTPTEQPKSTEFKNPAEVSKSTKAAPQKVEVVKPVESRIPSVGPESHESEVNSSVPHNKVQVSAAETKAGSVSLAVELSVEVDDDMSRRYSGLSSSGKGGEDYDSSFSRRSIKRSAYGTDGLSSSASRYESSLSGKYGGESLTSKYGSDSVSSKYGVESSLSGKHGTESSISNKYSTESSLSGKYGAESSISNKYGTESSLSGKYGTESLTSKYGDYSSKYGDIGDTGSLSSSYARRSVTQTGDADSLGGKYGGESALSSSYTSRRVISDSGNGDGGLTSSSYTRKYHHESGDADDGVTSTYTRKYGTDSGDGDSYSYSRKTVSSLEGGGDLTGGSKYSSRRMVTSATDLGDLTGGTRYTRKTVTSYGDDDDAKEALIGKYLTKGGKESSYEKHESVKRSISEHGADDDVLSKYSKYERRISETTKKAIPEDKDEDAKIEAEMRRKYAPDANKESGFSSEFQSSESRQLRSDASAEKSTSETREFRKSESVEKHISESREFRSSESAEKQSSESRRFQTQESIEEERLSELRKFEAKKATESEERKFSAKESESESKTFSGKESESESKFSGKESESESKMFSARESSETKSQKFSADEEFKKSESGYSRYESTSSKSVAESTVVNGKTSAESVDSSGSVATTFKIRRDSSVASVPIDGKPNFIKKLFGVNVEPGESAVFEVELSAPPDNLTWLKDNKPLSQSKRIKTSKTEEDKVYRLEIKEAETRDAGLYSTIATNSSGKSTCSAQLIVHELSEQERSERLETDKPVFLVQLKDTELLEDTYLRFMVKVKGDPIPNVTFYKDDIKIRESNTRCHVVKEAAEKGFYQLVIPEVKQEDAGLYKCVASNKFGEISSEATVTVTDYKNLFEDLPKEPLLEPGEKPVFVWKKDGIAFEPEERFKVLLGDDEDSLALIFQHVRPEDAGLYTCVAQTSSGHISCSAELTVHGVLHQLLREPEKPKLEMEKKEAIAAAGSSAMLELQVKGYPKPQVKWTHEGKPIEPGGRYKFLYEDEESMSLVIKNVQAEDAGTYQAEARNELGSDTAEMTLTVKAAPKIKTKIQDVSEAADLTIKIPVVVEGIPKPTVQFYKDGQEIKKNERIKVVEEGDKHILVIEKSEIKDSGSYSITASNEISQVSKFWSMDVHSKPKIIKNMDSEKIVSEKENVTLSVQVESKPEPEVKWYKDGEEITSDQYLIKKDGDLYMLKISGAVSTDASRYQFNAKNIYGSVDTDCQVYVKTPPKITKPLKDMTVTEHENNVELDVKMEAFPKPTVKWYLDEMEITESRTEFTRIESDDGSKLVIREVTSDLSGQYKCKVINELGETETSAKLTVNCKPRVIKHLKDTTVDEGATLHLEVEVEACPEPTVKWLRNGREVSADARIKITRDTHRKENYHLAVDLIKYEEQGEYEVIVTNSLGTVNSKSTVTVQKVTHSDAIEEDEPPKKHKLKVEVVENEPEPQKPAEKEPDKKDKLQKSKSAEKVEKVEIEELDEEEPIKPKEKEIEKPKSAQGISSEKYDIEIDEQILKSPEPIIEEPLSPEDSYQAKRLQKEKAEVISTDETSTKSKPIVEDDVPQKKRTRGKSVQFEEDDIVEITEEVKTPVQEEVPKRKLSRGLSAQKEDAEIIDYNKDEHEPKTPVEEEVPKRKLSRGLSAKKEDAEIMDYNKDEHKPKTPVENDVPKRKLSHGLSAQKEDAEVIDYNKDEHEPKTPVEEEVPKRKLSRGLSGRKEEAEIIDYSKDEHKPKTPVEDDVPKRKLSRGWSAQKEDAEVIEQDKNKSEPKTPVEEEVPKKKLGRGLSAQKEEAEIIENKDDQRKPKTPIEEDVPKKKLQRAISSQKEEAELVENEIGFGRSSRRASQQKLDRQESQKGVKSEEDDDEMEALLRRAQRQRSLVEDIAKGSEKAMEAAPTIIDSNMKDKSQYESLDLCYVVKAAATPQPTAVWTVDGKPIKADSHVQISDNGEEFKLEIKKLDLKDAGVYECKLSNVMGDVKKQATLSVIPEADLRKPKIKKGLEDKTIMKNRPAKLTAVITGEPVPEVTWCINGKEITPDQYEKYKIVLDAEDHDIEDGLKECTCSLTIPKSDQANSGKYTIKAKNKWGEAESSAQLTIVLRPEIEGPEDVSVIPGNGAEFTVIIKANPEPDVTWYKDGKLLETGHGLEIVEDAANEMYKIIIRNVQLADEGRYKVTAKNELGEESSDAKLRTVKEAGPTTEKPKFITGLSDTEVQDGGEITLMVRADGLPKPEIRWFLNGKPLQEDDNHKIVTKSDTQVTSTLAVTGYNKDDIGQYKAMAVNIVGEAETTAQISMIKAAPSFGKRLDLSEDVDEGEPLELRAKILGSPKPTVQWYKDGEPIPVDDDRIKTTLLPDGTVKLNIDKVTPGDSGAYKLAVKNPHGETSSLCAVAVNPKPTRPKFLKCIKDAKVTEGEPLRLEAQVSGYPPPEIKWLKDGVPIRPSSNIHLEEHPDGTVALVIDAVKPENAGTYTLTAVNKLGEGEIDAKVEIEKKPSKPEFITKMQPLTVVEGFPAKFEVKAKGFPAPTITWTRNGIEIIPDNKHIKITNLPDGTSVLLIDGCDIARDPMPYKAVASNEAGDAETSAELAVTPSTKEGAPEEPPVLLHSLRDVVADEGQPLVMEVPFTANPMPSVEWFKDDEPLQPSDRTLLTCDGKKVGLHIDNATPADAGKYSVKLSNPLGSDDSEGKAAIHKVFSPPRFTQRFTDLQQKPDRDAKFSGKVSGVPTPEVTWYKDGVALSPSDKYRIKRDGDVCSLYISDCKPSDAGVYRAFAVNKEGSDTCEAKLDIVDKIQTLLKAEPPSFLKRIGDLDLYKGMTAKFTACATGFPEPTVEWYKNDQKLFPSDRIKMEVDRAGLLRFTISGISEDDLGKYSCKISNEHGSDICHANLQFDELDAKPRRSIGDEYLEYDKHKESGIPVPLSDAPIVSRMTDRHCTLSWRPSIPSYPRAPVTYQLEMCELPHGDWFTARSGIRNCVCTVGNLEPFRDYRFRVRVENKYGISDPSPYATTHRQKLEPEPPRYRSHLPAGMPFLPDSSPYFPKDFDIDRPPHSNMAQAPRFLRQEHPTQYGVKDQNTNLFWYVYGYPKPKMQYYFNDEPIESGGRFDMSYTRNGQATLFINKMLDRDVGWYEAVATNEHGQARQRVRLEIAELPEFIRRPEIEYSMLRGKVRFEARILGKPYPEVKWYKDWKPLADSSRIKIRFVEPDLWIFSIDDVILKDAGLYSVSARNVAGTVSSSAMLYVDENDFDYNLHTYGPVSPIRSKRKLFEDYYDLGDELGRGTQGITYHSVERGNGYNYAAKVMHGHGDVRPFMYNELDMMNQLRHRRLISLHDAYETDDRMILVMEMGGGGELVRDYLLRRDYYTESDIAFYIRQLLEGIHYMHDRGYGHMGLNIGDLLLSHPGGDDLKITDFGLTRRIIPGSLYPLPYGVPEYVSPEAVLGEGTGFGHDMWSIGIITHILLSGRSPFLGRDDRETLTRIKDGSWAFDMDWWSNISLEARDFISQLLVYSVDGRMDIYSALRHPWLERAGRTFTDEYRISSSYLRDYFLLYREWYDNASCRRWYRRRPLEGAFTHPSRMVYPPGEFYTPPPSPAPKAYILPTTRSWEDQLPSRSPLNYEIGLIKSESHYQNGPDTYLLQLRDVNFPVRVREYMKVAANRGPGRSLVISNENGFDWDSPTVRERRRFTDVMDEEIDDERKARINRYGADNASYNIRRLRRELGPRLDTYAEAEAMIEMKQEGRLPFFREKPQITAMVEGQDLDLTCYVVGDPQPVVQWFKNDAIVVESARVKIDTDLEGRTHFKLRPALGFDLGMYRVVARNKVGQTSAWTRIVFGQVPDSPDSPEAKQISDTEILLIWKPPKCDGNSSVLCYSLQYKLADDSDWIKKADNIDHEFYLMTDLEPDTNYMFRLAANNAIGWSEQGVPTAATSTLSAGSPKIQLSTAMKHLQQITDSGQEVEAEVRFRPDYNLETEPVDWAEGVAEEHYEFISEISRGKYSAVLKGIDKRTDKLVVAKLVDLSTETAENLDGEFAALRSLRHERIAGLLAAYRTSDVATFILEKLQGADVLTYLASKHEYTEQTVATIVTQVLNGLQYLHWRNLCHLDIQPDNVVMCGLRSVQVKLVDFGNAHRVTKLGTKVPVLGHPDYISPEVLNEEPAFPQTDIWSLGVLTYVMLSGMLPFRGDDDNESRQNITFVRYRFEYLYQELSQEGNRFIMQIFKRNPNKRPTAEECHENRWLLPADSMMKKRERAVFLGSRLKEYSEKYHSERVSSAKLCKVGKSLVKSHSVQEELLTAT